MKKNFLWPVLSMLSGAAFAQSNAPAPMSVNDAVAFALRHGPAPRMARADALAARGAETSTRAGLLPQANVVGEGVWSQNPSPVRPAASPQEIRFANATYSVRLEVSQLLFDFGRTRNRLAAARSRASASEGTSERRRDETAFRVVALFHQLAMIDDLERAANASKKSLRRLCDDLRARMEVGKTTRLDLLKAEVKLSDVESRLAELRAQRVSAQSDLLSVMGWEGPAPDFLPPAIRADAPSLESPTNDVAEALRNRADLLAAERRAEAGEAEETSARRARWPTISGFGGYGTFGGHDPEPGNPWGNWSDDWEANYYVGVRLVFPIFDSGLRSGEIASAAARRMEAEAVRLQTKLRVEREVRTALAELESARVRLSLRDRSVEAARRALEDERKKYDAGKSTMNDLLDAETANLLAESQRAQALHEREIARFNLQLATGRPPLRKSREQ